MSAILFDCAEVLFLVTDKIVVVSIFLPQVFSGPIYPIDAKFGKVVSCIQVQG